MLKNAEHAGTMEDWERMWTLSKDKWFRHPRYQETIAGILRKWFAGRVILDIGCGTGDYLTRIQGSCRPIGIDISLEALKLARGLRVIGSAESLPFRSGSVGGIFSIGTFHCLPHPQVMLEEAHRILEKDGLLILVVPSARSLPGIIKRFFNPFFRLIFRMLENDRMPDVHRAYTLEALTDILSVSRFTVLGHHLIHIGYAFKSPLIRLPLSAIERLHLHRMAEEIVIICTRVV